MAMPATAPPASPLLPGFAGAEDDVVLAERVCTPDTTPDSPVLLKEGAEVVAGGDLLDLCLLRRDCS